MLVAQSAGAADAALTVPTLAPALYDTCNKGLTGIRSSSSVHEGLEAVAAASDSLPASSCRFSFPLALSF